MKKIFALVIGLTLILACSSNNDTDGNSTTTVVPLAPSNLTGLVTSSTQIILSWTDNSTNEMGFKIERKTGAGTYSVIGNAATDITTYSDTNLTPSTSYTYRMSSNNAVGNSLTYSNELTLITNSPSVIDIDQNSYQLVTICNQTWIKSNLNVTKYRNGDIIPQVTDPTAWANLSSGAWCYYNNDPTKGTTYGKLYNWYAIKDARGLAPAGYHIPSDAEWSTLINCLGGETVAGGKMKSTGTIQESTGFWQGPNVGATNESGFTGLPGGFRDSDGLFYGIGGFYGKWWSSSENSTSAAEGLLLANDFGTAFRNNFVKKSAFTVRCVKD